ncbi:unnamed protein product [Caenorhabditis brenneri]
MEVSATAKSPQTTPGRSKSEHKHLEHYVWCMQCSDQSCPLQQKMVFEEAIQNSNTESSKSGAFLRAVCNRISLRKKSKKVGAEKNETTIVGAKHLVQFGEKLNAHQKVIQKKQRAVSADSSKKHQTSGFFRAGQFMRSHRARFSLRIKSKKGGSPDHNKSMSRESIALDPREKQDESQKEKPNVSAEIEKPQLASRFYQFMRSGRARLSLRKKSKKVGQQNNNEGSSLEGNKPKSKLTRQKKIQGKRRTISADAVKDGSNPKCANKGWFMRSSRARFSLRKNSKKDQSSREGNRQEIIKMMEELEMRKKQNEEPRKPLRRYNGRSRLDQFIMNGGQLKPLHSEANV